MNDKLVPKSVSGGKMNVYSTGYKRHSLSTRAKFAEPLDNVGVARPIKRVDTDEPPRDTGVPPRDTGVPRIFQAPSNLW